jgi:beta-N-acetylhexosaminidase
MTIGPLMLDLEGLTLKAEERELLRHPLVGGVILFARNYQSPEQVLELTGQIKSVREPRLLIAVDQEGGRVQRFREGFTRLPPAAWLGERHRVDAKQARWLCEQIAWLAASELRAVGVDFNFAPVLDLRCEISEVIGDRAFAEQPWRVAELGQAWMRGSHAAGMAVVGKHFPGHGMVRADSHRELPVDDRALAELLMEDLLPFERLIGLGLEAMMPAHVLYPSVDNQPAGFSRRWLKDILRTRLGFQGVIFSDDLSMEAASVGGGYGERAQAALAAGCDMVLACNNRHGALEVLRALEGFEDPAAHLRMLRMYGKQPLTREQLHLHPRWREALGALADFDEGNSPMLEFGV